MARSKRKGPYCAEYVIKKTQRAEKEGSRKPIRIYARGSTILPQFVNRTYEVHNGKEFISVFVLPDMVGLKFGMFALTRKFVAHGGDKKTK